MQHNPRQWGCTRRTHLPQQGASPDEERLQLGKRHAAAEAVGRLSKGGGPLAKQLGGFIGGGARRDFGEEERQHCAGVRRGVGGLKREEQLREGAVGGDGGGALYTHHY